MIRTAIATVSERWQVSRGHHPSDAGRQGEEWTTGEYSLAARSAIRRYGRAALGRFHQPYHVRQE